MVDKNSQLMTKFSNSGSIERIFFATDFCTDYYPEERRSRTRGFH